MRATFFVLLLLATISGDALAADRMDIVDFKTDKATLRGRTLELEGFLMPFTEGHGLLAASIGDLHPVFIDVSKVDRDQRRRMMACPTACKAVVRGKVGTVSVGQIGLVADKLTFPAE